MKKSDFVKMCAEKAGLSQRDMREVLDIVGDCVAVAMKDEDGVSPFAGVKFYTEFKEARMAKNPRTGEPVQVEAKYRPKARFGVAIKEAINA